MKPNTLISLCIIAALVLISTTRLQAQKKEFTVVPYINYSRTIGFGFGLVPMYSFKINKKDEISPNSTVGMVGIYTTNKSYAYIGFGNLFLAEDKWRIQFGLGLNKYNFQTYFDPPEGGGEGLFVDYGTKSFMFTINARRKIAKKIFVGLGYIYQDSKTDFNGLLPESEIKLNTIQYELYRDTRDNVNYPRKGSTQLLRFRNIPTWLDNEEASNIIIANFNNYHGIHHNRDVLAWRFHLKAGLQNVSFQQQPVLGGVDLRGYASGKYRGKGVMDIQGEYRWNFPNSLKLSAVGFAGLGTLYGSTTTDFNWKLYPSIGAGIRYTALKSIHANVGIDVGFGKDDWGVYFRFNEAF